MQPKIIKQPLAFGVRTVDDNQVRACATTVAVCTETAQMSHGACASLDSAWSREITYRAKYLFLN